jgi:hypothetical protein
MTDKTLLLTIYKLYEKMTNKVISVITSPSGQKYYSKTISISLPVETCLRKVISLFNFNIGVDFGPTQKRLPYNIYYRK